MSKVKLNDALTLIQNAGESIANNTGDQSYCDILGSLVERFKQQLSQDLGLPIEFFEPVNPDVQQEIPADEEQQQADNPELTLEAEKLYREIETSI